MSYTDIGYKLGWLGETHQERLARSTKTERPVEELLEFPKDISESRTKDIYPADLDRLATAVGWSPRGKDWEALLSEASKVVSLWYQSTSLIGFARMVRVDNDAILSDGMIHPNFQSKGYFKLLIERGIQEMRSDGIETAHLYAGPGTERMYKHLGWEATNHLMPRDQA